MRSQGREVEGKGRRVVTASTWRNKNDFRGRFYRSVVQIKKDVFEGGAERPTFWTITKDEDY